jgi:hypothetical protein
MHRCALPFALAAALALPAAAQMQRNFTDKALRGEVAFGAPPQVTLDGKPARLAPGARVRDANNLLVVPSALAGRRAVVNYTTELEGMLLDVWILTPAEAARKPWPRTQKQAQEWTFDFNAQTWTEP